MAREKAQEQIEHDTFIAYQTVRIWVLTKNKKKMPNFADMIPRPNKATVGEHNPVKAQAFLEVLAARMGGRVRPRSNH